MTRPRPEFLAGLLGGAFVLALAAFHAPGYERHVCFRPEIRMGSILALILGGGVGLILSVEIVAAVAGRGRTGAAWPRAHEAARWIAAGTIAAALAWNMAETQKSLPAHRFQLMCIFGGMSALALVATRATGARGGPSLLALLAVVGTVEYWIISAGPLDSSRYMIGPAISVAGPLLAVRIAMWRFGFSRDELRGLGVGVYAPGDLGLAPAAVTFAVATYAHWAKKSGYAEAFVAKILADDVFDEKAHGWYWAWLLPTAAAILALRYLARRRAPAR